MYKRIGILVLALFGAIFVLNPLYLYPDGGGEFKVTYHVETIENESMAYQALTLSHQVLSCPGERPCKLETEVLESGSVEYNGYIQKLDKRDRSIDRKNPQWYSVVIIDRGTYIPENNRSGNTTEITLRNVSSMEAVEHTAEPAEEYPHEVREAVKTGSVTVYGEHIVAFEQHTILEHNGQYYYHTRYEGVGGHWTGGQTILGVRAVLFSLGFGMVAYAGWRWREVAN